MILDRYHYSLLSAAEKDLYRCVYRGLQKMEERIPLNGMDFRQMAIDKVWIFINLDNPALFYVDFSEANWRMDASGACCVPRYYYTKADTKAIGDMAWDAARKILGRVSGRTEYEKELSVHNILTDGITYDDLSRNNAVSNARISNTIIGALLNKTAVCEGIAKTNKLLLNMLDIKCIVVQGRKADCNTLHAWNIVKIEGESYHTDATWDINLSADGVGGRRYDYFNITTQTILTDHVLDFDYPLCTAYAYNYFYNSKKIAGTYREVRGIVDNAKQCGERFISLKVAPNRTFTFNLAVGYAVSLVGSSTGFLGKEVAYSINRPLLICNIAR